MEMGQQLPAGKSGVGGSTGCCRRDGLLGSCLGMWLQKGALGVPRVPRVHVFHASLLSLGAWDKFCHLNPKETSKGVMETLAVL